MDAHNDSSGLHALAAALHPDLTVEHLQTMLESLSERELLIIKMRYGTDDGVPKSLDEIASFFGVTRERIRQIESKTMSRLKHPRRLGLSNPSEE